MLRRKVLWCLAPGFLATARSWSIISEDLSGIDGKRQFALRTDSGSVACSQAWTPPALPTAWTKCSDADTRWHFVTNSTKSFEIAHTSVSEIAITLNNTTLHKIGSGALPPFGMTSTTITPVPLTAAALYAYSASNIALPDGYTGCQTSSEFVVVNQNALLFSPSISGHGSAVAAN
jgi:hypothetical protein